jgi:ribonuclease G
MAKEMIVSVNGREKKIAIVDNGRVTEFYIERGEENSGVVGNIYKGRVQRVLPGMQSAFVEIGLERDAFLYVSDFFDEEEEIERIVMEKSKKTSPEEAKREAADKIERARVEREKQMESAQEIAEPLAAAPAAESPEAEDSKEKKGRRRGRKERAEERTAAPDETAEPAEVHGVAPEEITFDLDDSSFERVIDDGTGELFKDAYRQEAIVDKVRAIEFDMEPTTAAEVGSLIDTVDQAGGAFERIADEDEAVAADPPAKTKGRKKTTKAKAADTTAKEEKPKRTRKTAATKEKTTATRSRSKKAKAEDVVEAEPNQTETAAMGMPDGEASVRETGDISEMAVRRGGRGRRRGGRGRRPDRNEDRNEAVDGADIEPEEIETEIEAAPVETEKNGEEPKREDRGPREARETRGRGRDRG